MKMMSVALPVMAIAGAAFTGGTSLGLLGADSAMTAADVAAGASTMEAASAADEVATFGTSTLTSITPYLKAASAGAQIVGTVSSAVGAHNAGEAAKSEATQVANQNNQNANNALGVASENAFQQTQATKYALSNAQAAAAAGGGGATDPTVNTVMNTIAGQGKYRSMIDMYNGQSKAQADRSAGTAAMFGGQQAARAGNMKAGSDLFSGGSSLFDKYGNINKDLTDPNNTANN